MHTECFDPLWATTGALLVSSMHILHIRKVLDETSIMVLFVLEIEFPFFSF